MYNVFIENNKLLFLEYSTFSILELKGIKAMTYDRFCYYTVVTWPWIKCFHVSAIKSPWMSIVTSSTPLANLFI